MKFLANDTIISLVADISAQLERFQIRMEQPIVKTSSNKSNQKHS